MLGHLQVQHTAAAQGAPPRYQLDTFALDLVTGNWTCLRPSSLYFPVGAAQARFSLAPIGGETLHLTAYGAVDAVACGNTAFVSPAGSSPFLETYAVNEINAFSGTVAFSPLRGYHASFSNAAYWQQQCRAQLEARGDAANSCACTSQNLRFGSRSADGTFDWELRWLPRLRADGPSGQVPATMCRGSRANVGRLAAWGTEAPAQSDGGDVLLDPSVSASAQSVADVSAGPFVADGFATPPHMVASGSDTALSASPSGVGNLLSITNDGTVSTPAASTVAAQTMSPSAMVDVAWRLPLLFHSALLPLPSASTLLDGGFTYTQLSSGAYTFALDDEISGTGGGPAFVARERLQMQSVLETYLVLDGPASVRARISMPAPALRVRGVVVCVTLARCVDTQLDCAGAGVAHTHRPTDDFD